MDTVKDFLPTDVIPIWNDYRETLKRFYTIYTSTQEWNGIRLYPGYAAENLQYIYYDWDIPENSVFVTTYPKTGTHWTYQIVEQILYHYDRKYLQFAQSLPLELKWIDMGPVFKIKILESIGFPRPVFVSHLHGETFNFERMKKKNGKMIYVIRNPKDRVTSWYHHIKSKSFENKELRSHYCKEWNQFFDDDLHGRQILHGKMGEGYPEHIKSWWKFKGDESFLLLVYEDMIKDLPREISRIADFLDIELTRRDILEIAELFSFDNMKMRPLVATERNKSICRKGKIGDWKNQFTVSQSELMDKVIEDKLGDLGIKFVYE